MDNKKIFIIIAIILAILTLIAATVFEIKEVAAYNWRSQYNFDKKEPLDAFVFAEMLNVKYGDDKVEHKETETELDTINSNTLYINIGSTISFNSDEKEELREFIAAGNKAILLGEDIDFDITAVEYEYDSLKQIYEIDTTAEKYATSIGYEVASFTDTIFHFDYTPFDSAQHRYSYINTNHDLNGSQKKSFNHLYKFAAFDYESLAYTKDSLTFFCKVPLGEGALYIHTVPSLFTNIGTEQEYYLDHFNYVFSQLTADKVILEKANPFANLFESGRKNSPLEYILSIPALSWAYYLLVLTLILFVIFRGKRTQRVIPTIQENKNTSMDYIKTLSTLYQNQGQNTKLVNHIRDGFFHRIKSKYYLDNSDELFIDKLAAKSKIEKQEIENLVHKLTSKRGSTISDNQLIILHKQIESFYHKAK